MSKAKNLPIIIDNGSGVCKVGICGDEVPCSSFPSVVGRPKEPQSQLIGLNQKDKYVGDQAFSKRSVLKLSYPINHGIIQDWEAMTQIWNHSFSCEVRLFPHEHPCFLTTAPRNPKNQGQKMSQIMFSRFQVPSIYVAKTGFLSLYASGRTTGLVLEAGDGVTHTLPAYDGYTLQHCVQRNDLGGKDLTEYLQRLLNQAGLNYYKKSKQQTIRQIKQKLCYVALDYEQQLKKYQATKDLKSNYVLPDGKIISVSQEKFKCSESLFNPILMSRQQPGLHEIIQNTILKCDEQIRRQLYSNIILSGGTTMLPGIQERLSKQMVKLAAPSFKVKVCADGQRKYYAWIGASILTSLSTFSDMWVTKAQYQENGPRIIYKKCF